MFSQLKYAFYTAISLIIFSVAQPTFATQATLHNGSASVKAPLKVVPHKQTNIFTAAQNASWFEQGNPKAPHQLYVIAEPNCSACHYLYESIRPYIGNGSLKVRWIMVAFLKPSSLGKAATIVSSRNPAQALESDESGFNAENESGGIVPKQNIYPGAKKVIMKNTAFMKSYGFKRTPIIIFKTTSGKTEVLRGTPEQNKWPQILPYIGEYNQ